MSIFGIDFGNDSCVVTAPTTGGVIGTFLNDFLRSTPTCLAFDERKRTIGADAKNKRLENLENTISGFKHFIGRKFYDPCVQRELSYSNIKVMPLIDGKIGIKVNYLGVVMHFRPVQLAAMLLRKLNDTAINQLPTQPNNECVIACPVFFTEAERHAFLDACTIAGLNVLSLIHETTAAALTYGYSKWDLPVSKPRLVIFVDCGHSSLQVSACEFVKGGLRMLAHVWERIGGRDIDAMLAEHFASEFRKRYHIVVARYSTAFFRLLIEVEKLKQHMSTNDARLPLKLDSFTNNINLEMSLQRSEMEEICKDFFKRVEATFRKLLLQAKIDPADIYAVEIVGGTTRLPGIQRLIQLVFEKPASATFDQDEIISTGATIQCAMLSSQKNVRKFLVIDFEDGHIQIDNVNSFTIEQMQVFMELEDRMIAMDIQENNRTLARYALIQEIDKIKNVESLEKYVTETDFATLTDYCQELNFWLCGEGKNCERAIYVEKLGEVRNKMKPISERIKKFEECEKALDTLKIHLKIMERILHLFIFESITETIDIINEAQNFYKINMQHLEQTSRLADCAIKHEEIVEKIELLKKLRKKLAAKNSEVMFITDFENIIRKNPSIIASKENKS